MLWRGRMTLAPMDLPALGQIHDWYLALSWIARERFGGSLAGRLLLRTGFDAEGIAALIGASVAGAASLCVDADGQLLREGLRAGLCDFLVGHADESLRILKNEIRRGRAVSVCLEAEPEECLAELAERGVQPDLVAPEATRKAAATEIFVERGALVVASGAEPPAEMSLLQWSADTEAARLMPQIGRIAAESLDEARGDTPARRRWLQSAPRYLGRAFGARLCVRMTAGESGQFLDRVRVEVPTASVTQDGTPVAPADR